MTDYETFCDHYQLDPSLSSSRLEYQEAMKALRALYGASAEAEASEAIDKARDNADGA